MVAKALAPRASALQTSVSKAAAVKPASVGARARTGTWKSFRYAGPAGSRAYFVHVPAGIGRAGLVPLLVALHGCGQDAADFAATTRFNQLADRHGFLVAYPQQSIAHNSQRCWNWFRPAHQHREAGEPAIIAGIVRRILDETRAWHIDPTRVYAAGLSAGGAMAAVLAATYPDLFAAVGVHSAPPYGSASSGFNAQAAMAGLTGPAPAPPLAAHAMAPMVIFHGSRDPVVNVVNANRLADQWCAYNLRDGLDEPAAQIVRRRATAKPPATPATASSRRGHQVQRSFDATGRNVLEVWQIEGLGHAWCGGTPKGSYSDPRGPRASTEIWRFLSTHRLSVAGGEDPA